MPPRVGVVVVSRRVIGQVTNEPTPSVYSLCMARRNISLPDDLDEQARRARLNVSALARQAVEAELDRRRRMARLDAWLDDLDAEHGPPSDRAMADARKWVATARRAQPRGAITRSKRATRAAG